MKRLAVFQNSHWTLRRKLFNYMLALAVLLLFTLLMGLFLFGQFESTEKKTFDALDVQMEVFEKDIYSHFDSLAAAGIHLSEDTGILLDDYFTAKKISFSQLMDNSTAIEELQEIIIEPMRQMLLQEDCSGCFVMLNTTVNSALPDAENSRAGLYLQINGYDKDHPYNRDVLLYRGLSQTAKVHDIMPHRKWRLEFSADQFPNYEELVSLSEKPTDESYFITDLAVLPGTSDQVILLAVPVTGSDGTFYGICGLEVSASYFMTYHAQPTKVNHLSCLLAPGELGSFVDADSGLSCGTSDGYYRTIHNSLSVKAAGNELVHLKGDTASYIGITRSISLSPNNGDYTLAVMMPKTDFDQASNKNLANNLVLMLLLTFFAVTCCLYCSRRFIIPVLHELDRLKKECAQSQKKYESAQEEISRLAYSRKTELDPKAYQQFKAGLEVLTPTERRIFDHYVDGLTVKEVIVAAGIKESTLRYHNQNIYNKLGVNSLKQMLRLAAIMQQEQNQ